MASVAQNACVSIARCTLSAQVDSGSQFDPLRETLGARVVDYVEAVTAIYKVVDGRDLPALLRLQVHCAERNLGAETLADAEFYRAAFDLASARIRVLVDGTTQRLAERVLDDLAGDPA